MTAHGGLIGRLLQTVDDLNTVSAGIVLLLDKARRTDDEAYLKAAALDMQAFYTGVERAFEAIAREVDGSLPQGPDWHRALLQQMSARIPGTRPPVIGAETRAALDTLLAFRHVVRNVYTFNLVPERIRDLAEGVDACAHRVDRDLAVFAEFLRSLDASP